MSFARVKPLGWAMFEVLTSAQMTQLDINVSKATENTFVKDYGSALFLPTKIPAATWTRTTSSIYIPQSNEWVAVDGGGCNRCVGAGSVTAASVFTTLPVSAGGEVIAYDGSSIIVYGSSTLSASSAKLRTSSLVGSNNFDTWVVRNTSTALSNAVRCITWFAGAGKFVLGLNDGKIETSPDGITWTARTPPDALDRTAVACSPTIAVMIQSTDVTHYATSPDGINWTQRTFPVTPATSWTSIAYSQADGCFLVMSQNGASLLKSTDGVNWTSVTHAFANSIANGGSFTVFGLRVLANLWLIPWTGTPNGLMCSSDVGATWKPLLTSTSSPSHVSVAPGQILYVDSGNAYFSSVLSL